MLTEDLNMKRVSAKSFLRLLTENKNKQSYECLLRFKELVGNNPQIFCMRSFGYIPGVRLSSADVSEPSVGSIF